MTVVNPKSISGINSITTGSGSDDILTIHNNNGTERLRIDSTGTTKITTGIVTTLTATTGIVTTLTTNTLTATTGIVTTLTTNTLTANSTAKVGSGVTLSPDGDIFATGVCTATSFSGDGSNLTGISAGTTLSGSTDNTVCTVTGANAIQGESGLTYNGTRLDVTTGDLQVIGGEGGDAEIRIVADQGDDGSDYWRFQSAASNNKLKLASYASGSWVDKVNVDTSGNLEVVGGNLVIGTSGKGIDFSADGNAGGMSSELLDDYEEGTFTPEFNSGGAASACYASGLSYSSQVGVYRKVGNVVHFIIKIQVSSGTLKSGVLQINNLPFTSGDFSTYSIAGGAFYSYTTGYFSDTADLPTIFIVPGGSQLQFYNTAGNNFAGSHLAQAAGRLDINGHYFTS